MNPRFRAEAILRVCAEIVRYRRELRRYAPYHSGSGAWLARIAPRASMFPRSGAS